MNAGVNDLDGLDEHVCSVLESLARALHLRDARLQPTLDAIVATAVETIAPASFAGLILVVNGVLVPQSTLGEPPQVLDLLQQALGEGPCMEAAQTQAIVFVPDTLSETRWPGFGERAVELGVSSMLCVPLTVDGRMLGALSLYGEQPAAFADIHLTLTRLYAIHAALALGEANRTEQLHLALANRDLIGQAKGILIERQRLSADAAFGCLSKASQSTNRKLVEIARHLVETGELLGPEIPA